MKGGMKGKTGPSSSIESRALGGPTEELGMSPLNWKVMTWSLGLFAAATFVVCVGYGLVMPTALHMTQFLEITPPGFRWLSVGSFI